MLFLALSGCTALGSSRPAVIDGTLADIRVAPSSHRVYSRDAFGPGWTDANGDCLDIRAEVLIEESLERARLAASGCSVVSGRWRDPYTGDVVSDARALDIDHVVPLAEAWRSGAWRWSESRRAAFANDARLELLPVDASLNRSKGDKDPADWLPPNIARQCAYVRRWISIKRTWGLTADQREVNALARVKASC
jgi:hypothetical protein